MRQRPASRMAEPLSETPDWLADVVITPSVLRDWPLPDPSGDKYDKGGLFIVGGGAQTPGAILLAAEAALRVGAGKVRMATVRSTAPLIATAVPEAFVDGLPEEQDGDIRPDAAEQILELAGSADAVLLGPGIMEPAAASALLERVVPHLDTTVLVDGIGLAYLTENLEIQLVMFHERVITLKLPLTVDLAVTDTMPAIKGATAQAQLKPATTETGQQVMVPSYIEPGERIRVDTRDGRFVERAK